MLQLKETPEGHYSLLLNGESIGTCLGDQEQARQYAKEMNAELILLSKPEMSVFVATLKVIRETEIVVRFRMPSEEIAKEFLDEIAFDSDADLGEHLEQKGEVVESDVRIEVGVEPELSTNQSQSDLTTAIEEFVDEYLQQREDEQELDAEA
jgi:hypothetical protein